jgi:hypothetical protein
MKTKHVFICYSRADSTEANRLKQDLQNNEIPCWLDDESIEPGTPNFGISIEEAIKSSQAVIYIASPHGKNSDYVAEELLRAKASGIKIIPFWVKGTNWLDSAPMGTATTQHIDARTNYDVALQKLLPQLGRNGRVPPPNQTRRKFIIVAILAMTILLVSSIGIVFINQKNSYSSVLHKNETQTATALAIAHATSTANSISLTQTAMR